LTPQSAPSAPLNYPRQALCDLTYEVSLAVVDFLQQRIAAIRCSPDRRVVGTGPDFNLRKKHLGHPTINPKWAACGKNEFPLRLFPFRHLICFHPGGGLSHCTDRVQGA
jgi:hypothetical protein